MFFSSIYTILYFYITVNPIKLQFRITFKIGDVFAARISETVGFAGLQKCGGAKYRRGRSPNGVLRNPKMPNRHFCANRVLDEVKAYTIFYNHLLL